MSKVIDPGHIYLLLTLDGDDPQTLRFVKREGPGFPGNKGKHSGTTMQSVLRAMVERIDYLDRQMPSVYNIYVRKNFIAALHSLEQRAAERHGYIFNLSPEECYTKPMCPHCGHTICPQLGNAVKV